MMTHNLKILPEYFDDVVNHTKNFEVRYNDRDYHVGDILFLREYDGDYTGRKCLRRIIYILDDEKYLQKGYVVLGLSIPYCPDNQ